MMSPRLVTQKGIYNKFLWFWLFFIWKIRPYYNQYSEYDVDGIYKCVVCDEDLFSSKTKYDSGSGWPSFYDAIQRDKLAYVRDYDIGMN